MKTIKDLAKHRPPGPRWPVFRNIFDLGAMPHQTLHRLRSLYGPVLWLRLGGINTVVIQSATAAAELYKNHDLHFADRKVPCVFTALDFDQGSMSMSNYGGYWRTVRKLCSMELMVAKRIREMAPLRRKCVDAMIRRIEDAAAGGGESGEVEVSHVVFCMAFNLIANLMMSRDFVDVESEEGDEFYGAMNKVMEMAGRPNAADFFPFLKWLDPQGIKRGMVRELGRSMEIVAGFVRERVEQRRRRLGGAEEEKKDFLDVLLEYRRDRKERYEELTDKNINIIILEMFFGGTETTSSTIEWAMTELHRKPKSMRKVKEEMDRVVGASRKVEESDIDELPYLQAVVKETLRLHPVLPLLLPRNASKDTEFMGYSITKNTQLLVNAWSIGRDPEVWDEPHSFNPERFLGSIDVVEYKGQNFEFIPFGSGRRMCVGMPFAHRALPFVLASLLHRFQWELPGSLTPETVDMNERVGLTLRKRVPLNAIPTKRVAMD